MALKRFREQLGAAAGLAAEKAAEAGGTISEKAADAGGLLAARAKEGAQLAAEAQLEAKKKRYAPVFPEEYRDPHYDLPHMIVIEDEDQRKGIDVCEGAIGWLSVAHGTEVLHLYHAFVGESGLVFHPLPQIGGVYMLDVSGTGRFMSLEGYFQEVQKEKMAELQNVAYCLGAKYCKLETHEVQVERTAAKKKTKLTARAGALDAVSATAEAERNETAKEDRRMLFERRFSGSDEPERPQLRWYKSSIEINNLIEMRCSEQPVNEIHEYVVNIDCRSSASLNQARAANIDKVLKGLKISLGASLKEESVRESSQAMVFTILF